MDWSVLISSALSETLKALVAVAVPLVLVAGGRLLRAAFDWLEAKTSREWARRLEEEAETVVLALWELAAKEIKAGMADGTLTREEARAALEKVKAEGVTMLQARLAGVPARFRAELQGYLSDLLESALARLKLAGLGEVPAPVPLPPADPGTGGAG